MNSVLRDLPGKKVKALVVWEPILVTDLEPPSSRELARVSDQRAVQFWDKAALVSRAIGPAIVARGQDEKGHRYRTSGERLWDTVAIYPPGVRWESAAPTPVYTGGPVVTVARELHNALRLAVGQREHTAMQGGL